MKNPQNPPIATTLEEAERIIADQKQELAEKKHLMELYKLRYEEQLRKEAILEEEKARLKELLRRKRQAARRIANFNFWRKR